MQVSAGLLAGRARKLLQLADRAQKLRRRMGKEEAFRTGKFKLQKLRVRVRLLAGRAQKLLQLAARAQKLRQQMEKEAQMLRLVFKVAGFV